MTGERLSEAMELRGVDQSALARNLGITQGTISKIILGKTTNSRLIPRIAAHLQVPVPWLLGLTDDQDQPEFGPDTIADPEARELLENFSSFTAADRRALLQIARSMRGGRGADDTIHAPRLGYRGKKAADE